MTIELRALAGATIPLVDPSYKVDAVVSAVTDGAPSEPSCYQPGFPYLADPHDGYNNPNATPLAHPDSGNQRKWAIGTGQAVRPGTGGEQPYEDPGPAPGRRTHSSWTSVRTSEPLSCMRTKAVLGLKSTSPRLVHREAITSTQ